MDHSRVSITAHDFKITTKESFRGVSLWLLICLYLKVGAHSSGVPVDEECDGLVVGIDRDRDEAGSVLFDLDVDGGVDAARGREKDQQQPQYDGPRPFHGHEPRRFATRFGSTTRNGADPKAGPVSVRCVSQPWLTPAEPRPESSRTRRPDGRRRRRAGLGSPERRASRSSARCRW